MSLLFGAVFGLFCVFLFVRYCAPKVEKVLNIKFNDDYVYWAFIGLFCNWFTPVILALAVLYYAIREECNK